MHFKIDYVWQGHFHSKIMIYTQNLSCGILELKCLINK